MTLWLAPIVAGMALAGAPEADSSLKVDAAKVVNRVSPWMVGSCIEDVNHEIYGGLYAQLIFGESFEEPPGRSGLPGWRAFGGEWSAKDAGYSVKADQGAKSVRAAPVVADGFVSCEVRLADAKGGNAGLILRVQEPAMGADAWVGYEVSLSARNQNVMLGRHRHDFHMLKEAPAAVEPGRWHRLRVALAGATIRVFVDGAKAPAISFDDPEPIHSGRVGVRTWESDASFRNLVIETADGDVSDRFEPGPDDPSRGLSANWDLVREGETSPRLAWDDDRPFNGAHSQRIEVGGSGAVGIANAGLNRWGLATREGRTYRGRCTLRKSGEARVWATLQSADGTRTYAKAPISDIGREWSRHDFSLKTDATDPAARFVLWVDGPGTVGVDQVYLSGTGDDLFEGLPVRGDIARALKKQGLTALRYGGLMVNAPEYRWKSMIGDPDKRPPYKGYWYPQSTNGFGIEEFVQFCQAAQFEPVVAINVEETPEDAADLVDYLNGPVSTKWGRRRAENGHAEPYGVRYIELGNEEKTDDHYLERFQILHAAMRPRDPKLGLVIAAWWEPDNPVSKKLVRALQGKASLWDVHVGGDNPREGAAVDATFTRMERLVQEWAPGTSLKAGVFEENGGKHDLARALGHAGILNATQRHGDFVLFDCPANCLQAVGQNDNGWDQGQLFYTPDRVWGMPPYHAQRMAAENHLPCRVASEVQSPGNDLDLTATRDEAGASLVLKVVNAGNSPHLAAIAIEGFGPIAPEGRATTLSGSFQDVNPPDAPDRIRPVAKDFGNLGDRMNHEFSARSYTVLRLKRRAKHE